MHYHHPSASIGLILTFLIVLGISVLVVCGTTHHYPLKQASSTYHIEHIVFAVALRLQYFSANRFTKASFLIVGKPS